MKDAITKASEISVSISVAFEDFDLVVAAFGETVGDGRIKGIDNAGIPVTHSLSTFFKLRDATMIRVVDPVNQGSFGSIGIFLTENFKELFFVPIGTADGRGIIQHNIHLLFLLLL